MEGGEPSGGRGGEGEREGEFLGVAERVRAVVGEGAGDGGGRGEEMGGLEGRVLESQKTESDRLSVDMRGKQGRKR